MWIEIDLNLSSDDNVFSTKWVSVINSKHIIGIAPNFYENKFYVSIDATGSNLILETFNQSNTNAIYNAFLMALQGNPVELDPWGHIKPLLNYQVEALHKRMLYRESLASLSDCEGLR